MQLWQIDRAIDGLCGDIEESINRKSYQEMSEREIIHELLICILGSGVRYEVAVSYADAISASGLLIDSRRSNTHLCANNISNILANEVASAWGCGTYKKYRYPNKRSEYIVQSINNIYADYRSVSNLLNYGYSDYDLRRRIIRLCPGVGPKQASHFLKNVGYSESLAILDRHILKYLEMHDGVSISTSRVGIIDVYEEIEALFVKAVQRFNYSISVIDQSMWFVMRAMSREAVA